LASTPPLSTIKLTTHYFDHTFFFFVRATSDQPHLENFAVVFPQAEPLPGLFGGRDPARMSRPGRNLGKSLFGEKEKEKERKKHRETFLKLLLLGHV
jgi:hypothetical protein